MPQSWFKARHRIRPLVTPNISKQAPKPTRKNSSPVIQWIQLLSAILVPLMIGAFTVVTTIQDSKSARNQREADSARVERQGQLQEAAEQRQRGVDALKLREQQDYSDRASRELRIENVFDAYMRDMTAIVLKPNANLTSAELLFVRSKTLLTLDQIDAKRKWNLVKFLYDSELLYVRDVGSRFVDLGGADLSNVRFGGSDKFDRRINLDSVRLSNMDMVNTSFRNVVLKFARFDYSMISHSVFQSIPFFGMSFVQATLEDASFDLTQLQNTSFEKCNLKRTAWTFMQMTRTISVTFVNYFNADLTGSRFQGMHVGSSVRLDQTNFDRSELIDMKFASGLKLNQVSLRMARFSEVFFDHVVFSQSNLSESQFENCSFRAIRFEHVDLQKTHFSRTIISSGTEFHGVNFLGSNFHALYPNYRDVYDSILSNGTFKTSFRSLEVNLIRNGDAEEGECFLSSSRNISRRTNPPGWSRDGDSFQAYYNSSDWKFEEIEHERHSCLFYGAEPRTVGFSSLRQEINVSQLALLIDTRRARYQASAYLGGFGHEPTHTIMKITFEQGDNRRESVTVGQATNIDRRNKTTLLFRDRMDLIPMGTKSVVVELVFGRLRATNVSELGVADRVTFIIKQRSG